MWIKPRCGNGVGFIVARDDAGHFLPFTLVGSSLRTSARAGDKIWQLSYYPDPAENDGVIGVIVLACDTTGEVLPLCVEKEKGKIKIDPSVPFWNLLKKGQVFPRTTPDGQPWIEVQIGDTRYTSNRERAVGDTEFVSSPDLLCRYWVGDVKAEEVVAAAEKTGEEASFREKFESLAATAKSVTEGYEKRLTELRAESEMRLKDSQRLTRELSGERVRSATLAAFLKRHWWLTSEERKAIKDVLGPTEMNEGY